MYLAEQELSLNTAVISVQAGLAEIAQGQTDVDLSAVTTVDSSAVAVMLEWQRAAFLILMVLVTVTIIDQISQRLRAAIMGNRGR